MIRDPPRLKAISGTTQLNQDYFILSFLWLLITFTIIVLLWVLTIPYYLHYKRWVFILSCALYPVLIILTALFFFIIFCFNKTKRSTDMMLLGDKTCRICQQSIHINQFHSYRVNRCIFNNLLPLYILFSISSLIMNTFQAAITLDVFIKYCRDKQNYNHYLSLNPTTKSQTFFTVINFLIMIISFVSICYEIYKIVYIIVRQRKYTKVLRQFNMTQQQKFVSPAVLTPKLSAVTVQPPSQTPMNINHFQKIQSVSTERPLSNSKSMISYFIHPNKMTDIPFSLRPGQKFIPTS